MNAIISLMISMATWILTTLGEPSSAECAPGFIPEGVRPGGETFCREELPSEAMGQRPSQIQYYLRIYCPKDHTAFIGLHDERLRCKRL